VRLSRQNQKLQTFFSPFTKKKQISPPRSSKRVKKNKLEKSNTNHDLSKVESFEIEIEKEREKLHLMMILLSLMTTEKNAKGETQVVTEK